MQTSTVRPQTEWRGRDGGWRRRRRVWQYAAKAVVMGGDLEGWPHPVTRNHNRDRLAQRRQYVQLYQHRMLAGRRQQAPGPSAAAQEPPILQVHSSFSPPIQKMQHAHLLLM